LCLLAQDGRKELKELWSFGPKPSGGIEYDDRRIAGKREVFFYMILNVVHFLKGSLYE